jgi:hypothetical protein
MDTVPFKVHDPNASVTETEGVMTLYEDHLSLQLETRDVVLGVFKRAKEFDVPLEEISSAEFRRRWYGTSLTLQVRDIELFGEFPGSRLGRVRLKFRRRDRDAAEELAGMIEDSLYDLGLAWEEEQDRKELGY